MAAATQALPNLLTIGEYLRTSYHPDCEFIDGSLVERPMGEREHSILQIALGSWFFTRRAEWRIAVMSEQRTRVSTTRVRLPDLCLVAADAPPDRVTVLPPFLAIELLSSDDRISRVLKRLDDFLDMGVENVWLIDPLERSAFTYTRAGLRLAEGPRADAAQLPHLRRPPRALLRSRLKKIPDAARRIM